MILILQVVLFLWVLSLVVLTLLALSIASVDADDLPSRKIMAMIAFWPLTLVALSPLIIVHTVKWTGILGGSFIGGIGELYGKAVR